MQNIPDHPEIACALATGYPKPFKEPDPVCCSECGKELVGTDTVFDYDGESLCANCCINRITDNYEVSEIAQALGIIAKKAEDFTEDDYE